MCKITGTGTFVNTASVTLFNRAEKDISPHYNMGDIYRQNVQKTVQRFNTLSRVNYTT